MAGKQVSYDYVNVKRDLGDTFAQVVKKNPVLSTMIRVSSIPAKNTKHEWLEDVVAQAQWNISSNYTVADGAIELTSNVGVKVGDILEFELSTGKIGTLNFKVTAVNVNGTTISGTVYGGSTDQNMLATTQVYLLARPKNEGTSADPDNGYEPSVQYNYTQIFDRTAKVSKTSVEIDKYGIGGAVNYQVERQLKDIAYEMNRTMLRAPRVQRASSEAGTMWGIMWFLKQGSGNVLDAANAAITMSMINDLFEIIGSNGSEETVVILCNPVQARKISAMNQSGNNPVVNREDKTTGSYVTTFVSDQGNVATIVADRNFAKDELALLDMTRVLVVPLKNRQFTDENAAAPGDDFVARRVLGEYTLEVKDASVAHGYIKNLSI